ncbi:MAG TPA: DMT family transporter [Pyrinomonadaceae bacterium]|nr:DMT family transporter [Pyrinomonadaceae bacterium]
MKSGGFDMTAAAERRAGRGTEGRVPPILFVLAAALLWSTGGLFIKATPGLSAYELSFGRSLLAALTVAYFTRREGFRVNSVTVVAAALYAALLLLFVMATKLTTAANAIFLQYTAPVYVLVFEPLVFKEKYRRSDFLVVAACAAGIALFFVGRLRPEEMQGNLLALLSGLCFAAFMLLIRLPRAGRVNRASSIIYGNLLLAAVCAPAFLRGAYKVTATDLFAIVFLGVVQIGVAYTLFTRGIERGVRSLDAGLVGYIEPLSNPLWVYLFMGERPSRWAIAGGCIIVAAVLVHTVTLARRKKMTSGSL